MAQETQNEWSQCEQKEYVNNINEMKFSLGTNRIRVLPKKIGTKKNILAYVTHWVPTTTGKKFPIYHLKNTKCKLCLVVESQWAEINRLKDEADLTNDSPEVKKIYTTNMILKAKDMIDMNIIDRNDPRDDEGKIKIKRLAASPSVSKEIVKWANDKAWGSPSHDETGYDLKVEAKVQGDFRNYDINPFGRDTTPLTKDELKALNESGYDLEECRRLTTEEKIDDVMRNCKYEVVRNAVEGKVVDFSSEDDAPADEFADIEADTEIDQEMEKATETTKKEEIAEPSKNILDEDILGDSDEDEEAVETLDGMECRGTVEEEEDICKECDFLEECRVMTELAAKVEASGKQSMSGDKVKTMAELNDLLEPKTKGKVKSKTKGKKNAEKELDF